MLICIFPGYSGEQTLVNCIDSVGKYNRLITLCILRQSFLLPFDHVCALDFSDIV